MSRSRRKPTRCEETGVSRGVLAKIGLFAGLAPALLPIAARAQVNIDAGKSPSEIYASDCATCHKTPRGLAAGKNSSALSTFLREHYTASPDQATALAAYVLGAGGGEAAPKQKPEVEHARAEEPKNAESRTGEAKPGEGKRGEPKLGQTKPAIRPIRAAAKPEEKRDNGEEAKQEPHSAPAAAEDRASSETASRDSKPEPREAAPTVPKPAQIAVTPAKDETPPAVPQTVTTASAPAAAAPAPAETRSGSAALPSLELGSSLNAVPPAQDRSSATETVPRDNIP